MAKLREGKAPPPWGATKKQAAKYQLERDRANREFLENCIHSRTRSQDGVHNNCAACGVSVGWGPANTESIAVTQELVALYYAEDPVSLGVLVSGSPFHDGLAGKPAPEDPATRSVWESGALAAHLVSIGGQR